MKSCQANALTAVLARELGQANALTDEKGYSKVKSNHELYLQ